MPATERSTTVPPSVGGAAAALVLLMLSPAACKRDSGEGCLIPAEACACAPGDRCDPGLSCVSGACVRSSSNGATDSPSTGGTSGQGGMAGSSSSGGGGAPAGGGDVEGIAPLPATAFVFRRRIARPPRDIAQHLYLFDLASRQERLLTDLDDTGMGSNAPVLDLAVSPDRKWIAFGASKFRPSVDDLKWPDFKPGILWAVSADGRQFRRLTPPISENWSIGANTCAAGSGGTCLDAETCSGGKCIRSDLIVSYNSPVWSSDGRTTYFHEFHSWVTYNISIVEGTHALGYLRGATTGSVSENGPPGPCSSQQPLDLHPQTGTLLVRRNGCLKKELDGLHELTASPVAEKRMLAATVRAGAEMFVAQQAQWLPDGSAVLIVAAGPTKKVVPIRAAGRFYRQGLYRWSEAAGLQKLFEPDSDDLDVESVAVSPNGQILLEMIRNVAATGDTSQLHLFDLGAAKLGEPLMTTGDNRAPAW